VQEIEMYLVEKLCVDAEFQDMIISIVEKEKIIMIIFTNTPKTKFIVLVLRAVQKLVIRDAETARIMIGLLITKPLICAE
jgi:hypothetical protein